MKKYLREMKNFFRPKPVMIVVLGMHRSGTSAITEALAATGLPINMGEHLLGAKPQNPHGFFEDKRVIKANQDFFEAHGCGVMDAEGLPRTAVSVGTERMQVVFEKLLREKINLIKDPRLCVTLPQWQQIWGRRVKPIYLHIWRNPVEVARSLEKRDGLDPIRGEGVWAFHVQQAVADADLNRSVFVIHSDLMQHPIETINRVASEIAQLAGWKFEPVTHSTIDPGLATAIVDAEPSTANANQIWKELSMKTYL